MNYKNMTKEELIKQIKSLEESEEKFRLISESTDEMISISTFGLNPVYTYLSPSHKKILGYDSKDLIGKQCLGFIHHDDKKKIFGLIEKYVVGISKGIITGKKQDISETFQYRFRDKKGKWHWLESTANFLKDNVIFVTRDISERMKEKDILQENLQKMETILESVHDVIFILSPVGVIQYVSPKVKDLYGYEAEELIGSNMRKTTPVKELPKALNVLKKVISGNEIKNFRINQLDRQQKIIPMEINIGPIKKDNKTISALGVMRDITGRVRAEEEIAGYRDRLEKLVEERTAELKKSNTKLQQEINKHIKTWEELKDSEERLKIMFEYAPDGYFLNDLKGVFIDGNKAAEEIIGYKKDELISQNFLKTRLLSAGELIKAAASLAKNALGIPTKAQEFTLNRKDGSKVIVEISSYPVKIKGKIRVLNIARNITKRKKVEKERENLHFQLIQSEKMAGIGTLVAGVAHEFNNLLTIISGQAFVGKMEFPSEDTDKYFDIIMDTSKRAAVIVENLALFSKPGSAEKKKCSIEDIINRGLSVVEGNLNKQGIRIIKMYRDTPKINVIESEMHQVFLNLVINARDAMLPEGGKIIIETDFRNDEVEIHVRDTGKGIGKGDLHRIFEPFFTTKGALGGNKDVQGTGLGLSVSYGIIRRHDGRIDVESKEGQGTIFKITLPVGKNETANKSVKKKVIVDIKKPAGQVSAKNVLVVDDEESICIFLKKALTDAGHKVRCALDGKEAKQLLKKEKADVVLLDLVIPGVIGLELLKEIRKTYPKLKIIVITGKVLDNKTLVDMEKYKIAGSIQKPFAIDEVLDMIN